MLDRVRVHPLPAPGRPRHACSGKRSSRPGQSRYRTLPGSIAIGLSCLVLLPLACPALAETMAANDTGAVSTSSCDTLEANLSGDMACDLSVGDGTLLSFDYKDTGGGGFDLTVSQTIRIKSDPIEVAGGNSGPALRDVTADGTPELFVPLFSGMVNVTHSVWMADANGIYAPVGEISGFGVDSLDVRDGLIFTAERSSAAEYIETALRITPGGVQTAYSLDVNYADRSCTLSEGPAFADAARSADEITADCEAREWE